MVGTLAPDARPAFGGHLVDDAFARFAKVRS
jgi:hypothetical protein